MTLSIHRAAWALTLALGIPALLLADRTARQIVTKAEAEVPDQEEDTPSELSTPNHPPEDVDSGGPRQVSQQKPTDAQSEASSRRKRPVRKSASRRRAEQILHQGRLALERGELRRAKQLVRLAERARVRFDKSDPDSPASLRDAIAEAEREAIRELDAIDPEPESSDPTPEPLDAIDPEPESSDPTPEPSEQSTQDKQPPILQDPNPDQTASAPVHSTPLTRIPTPSHPTKQQPVESPTIQPPASAEKSSEQIEANVEPIVQVAHEAAPALPAPEPAEQGPSAETTAPPWRRIFSQLPRRISQDALARRLLADARRAIDQGDLNGGAALALRAKGLYVKYTAGSDTPDKVLREVVARNRRRGFRRTAPPSPEAEPTTQESVEGNSAPHATDAHASSLAHQIGKAEPESNKTTLPSVQSEPNVAPVSGYEDDSVPIKPLPTGSAVKSDVYEIQAPPMEPSTEFEAAPPTYAPDDSLPSITPPEDFLGANPGAFSEIDPVPSLHAEPLHAVEPACSRSCKPQGHCRHRHRDGRRCKLSCWERLLRLLHPTHRRTPIKLPDHHNGFAGFPVPQWHRSSLFFESSRSLNEPGELPSKTNVLPR